MKSSHPCLNKPVFNQTQTDSGRSPCRFSLSDFPILTVAIVSLACCLTAYRTTPAEVVAWGDNTSGQLAIPENLTDVTSVAGGAAHGVALRGDGTMVAWGDGSCEQLEIPADVAAAQVVGIAAGDNYTLALKADGTVRAWGGSCQGWAYEVPAGLNGVVQVAGGSDHGLALRMDGTVVSWPQGAVSGAPPASLSGVVQVAARAGWSLALKGDGTVVAWDANGSWTVAGVADATAIAAGWNHGLALRANGTVMRFDADRGSAQEVAGWADVVEVGAGYYHDIALKSDGTVVTWGDESANAAGFLETPYGLQGVVHIAVGGAFNLAVVNNAQPSVGPITAPVDPVPVGTLVTAVATSTANYDLATVTWGWGDGQTSNGAISDTTITGSHVYTVPGVYTIRLTLTDNAGRTGTAIYQYLVVYDPEGGFVTGGGWINSPAGAYPPDPGLTGKATFGFVSKYQKGATVPTGQTQFDFHVANLSFHSSSYDWLVIAGAKAKYKGSGEISGSSNFGFMLTAIDGQTTGGDGQDKFRVKIWNKVSGAIVYDNQLGASEEVDPVTAITGGSIVIHKSK